MQSEPRRPEPLSAGRVLRERSLPRTSERESLVVGHDARIPGFPDEHSIRLALDGAFDVAAGNYQTVIDAESFLPFSHDTGLQCTAVPGTLLSWLYVGFSAGRFRRTAARFGVDQHGLLGFRLKRTESIREAVEALLLASRPGQACPETLSQRRGRLLELVLDQQRAHTALIDRIPAGNPRRRRDLYVRLQRTREFLETRYMDDPSVEQLASVAMLSRAHFLRLYKKAFRTTPHQDLISVKLMAACTMLRQTRQSIIGIAEACGFGNRCAFSRLFRQRIGMSPRQFRESDELQR